jgi:hypothetical protein
VDLTYEGKSAKGEFELFHLLSDGNRPVLELLVDGEDAIWVAPVDTTLVSGVPQKTKGVVHRHTDADLEASGIDSAHVCLGALAAYVIPRATTLMARVYCPAQPIQLDTQ